MIRFVLGGVRSGKSRFALKLGETLFPESPHYFIATAKPLDDEMRERIKAHQQERADRWFLLEVPVNLSQTLGNLLEDGQRVILIDCLGVWLTNLLFDETSGGNSAEKTIEGEIEDFLQTLTLAKTSLAEIILVSNEVGLGLVPESPLGRRFRDEIGGLNQRVSHLSDEIYFVLAGIPLKIKG